MENKLLKELYDYFYIRPELDEQEHEVEECHKALIAALLHLKKESIHDVAITNPIELGAAISDKYFILDIRVNLNNEQLIDLEMQMSNEYNWSERSISYAARSFDQLNSGEEYKEVLPVHSIGFLNFTLFEDQPEFFATYELRNKKNRASLQ